MTIKFLSSPKTLGSKKQKKKSIHFLTYFCCGLVGKKPTNQPHYEDFQKKIFSCNSRGYEKAGCQFVRSEKNQLDDCTCRTYNRKAILSNH